MAALVLDCSVTLAWFLSESTSRDAAAVLDRVVEGGATVPLLWPLEVGNVLLVAERRNRIAPGARLHALRALSDLPITCDPEMPRYAWTEAMDLAVEHGLTLYDATYLELALRRNLPLATFDQALRAAAAAAGVPPGIG